MNVYILNIKILLKKHFASCLKLKNKMKFILLIVIVAHLYLANGIDDDQNGNNYLNIYYKLSL